MKINFNFQSYKATIKQDLMGALLAAIIGLPMGLAFGVQSGLGPQAGIYTAILLPLIASFFGGTKTLISDPTGPMTVLAATVVTMGLAQAGDLSQAWPLIVATFVLAGILQTVFGVLDIGRYVKFMPYPVLSGFMAGIGIIIISVQLFPMMGQSSPKGFLNIISNLDQGVAHLNWQALLLGGLTIAIIYLLPLLSKKIPAILVALIAGTLVSVLFHLNVPVIGEIPRELPAFHLGEMLRLPFQDYHYILTPAIMLAGLGVIDSLLTSVVADNLTQTQHDSRWTVIGQGLGNVVTSLFGGIPGAGATMGTVTNIKSGARTKVSGIMKGVFLLAIVVGVAEYVQYIPNAVLAGILITIGVGIIDYKGVKMLLRVPKQDAVVWAVVLLVTLFDNLLDAVGIGFALSAILFIGQMSKSMRQTRTGRTLQDMVDAHELPQDLANSIHVEKLEGPLFFGFADQFRQHCKQVDQVLAVILKMQNVPFLDQSGIVTIESVIADWQKRGIQVYLVGANETVLETRKKNEVINTSLLNSEHCYRNLTSCVTSIKEKVQGTKAYDEALLDKHVLENRMSAVGAAVPA
ncbi:MAG: SulP family inorganic anion transporter [Phaeodactylibacter sp.]|nr:SulP family inorganic anion transporter [Phaeodactylibacter sp.]